MFSAMYWESNQHHMTRPHMHEEADIIVSGNRSIQRCHFSFAENIQSTNTKTSDGKSAYLHGHDAGRGVGHGSEALNTGEGRGGNSEHGELHGYKVLVCTTKEMIPKVRNCEGGGDGRDVHGGSACSLRVLRHVNFARRSGE